jgi:hypothetical protein
VDIANIEGPKPFSACTGRIGKGVAAGLGISILAVSILEVDCSVPDRSLGLSSSGSARIRGAAPPVGLWEDEILRDA